MRISSEKGFLMNATDTVLKTGTTTVGIVCKDGIVLAADKRATAGYIANKNVRKVIQITSHQAITTAGNVSDIQLLGKLIQAEVQLKDMQVHRPATSREVAHLLAGMLYQNIRRFSVIPGIAAFLLGGFDHEGPKLFELSPDGAIMEAEDYAADGSGSVFALGVLETLFKKGMTINEGIAVATKAVNAAIQRDMMSGNGITIMTITSEGVKTVVDRSIETNL